MGQEEIENKIVELEREIAILPEGSITKKKNFFFYDSGDKLFQFNSINDIDSYFLFILIKMIQRDRKILELTCENVAMMFSDDDMHDEEYYKYLYESSLAEIEELEKKIANKTKAYNKLKEKHEELMEKCNWDI